MAERRQMIEPKHPKLSTARQCRLLGLPRSEIPRFLDVMRVRGHLFIPVLVVLFGLILGFSAPLCALAGR